MTNEETPSGMIPVPQKRAMKTSGSQFLVGFFLAALVVFAGCNIAGNPPAQSPAAQESPLQQPAGAVPTMATPSFQLPSYAAATALPAVAQDNDINFYDLAGNAVAYIDASQDLTIYLWSGKPCAYLDGDDVYGFNGKHLGWFHSGVIYDHEGYAVVGVPSAFLSPVQIAPLKGLKQLCPLKSLKELTPLKPLFSTEWSPMPAQLFFLGGVGDGNIDLYDSGGRAVAYVDASQDLTVYLWSGKPCAYLAGEDVYGFNGKHLGWFDSEIVYDHEGLAIARVASAFLSPVRLAPLKGLERLCPLKLLKQLPPLKPSLSKEWSETPAEIFFLGGASEF